jgi:hypothetical protein
VGAGARLKRPRQLFDGGFIPVIGFYDRADHEAGSRRIRIIQAFGCFRGEVIANDRFDFLA